MNNSQKILGYARGTFFVLFTVVLINILNPGFLKSDAEAAAVAGETPGSFQVNQNGAATYRIPIQVPPGTNGAHPEIALAYNSQRGNGMVGVGWGIEGLTAITRCGQTPARDGLKGGVKYDAGDRFCVNGKKLALVVGTGAYGAHGSIYHTNPESGVKFYAFGACGSGPCAFAARDRKGNLSSFGHAPDSRIEAEEMNIGGAIVVPANPAHRPVRVWTLDIIYDRNKNYTKLTYIKVKGQYYPYQVKYTGNLDAGLAPQRTITFNYLQNRADKSVKHLAGGQIITDMLLVEIVTKVGETVVKKYKLDYHQANSATYDNHLRSVSECDADDNCLPPVTFEWQHIPMGLSHNTLWGARNGGVGFEGSSQWITDINGDGLADYVYNKDGTWHYYAKLNTGNGGFGNDFYFGSRLHSVNDANSTWIVDMNGDGKRDLVYATGMVIHVELNEGSSLGARRWDGTRGGAMKLGFEGKSHWVVDINGDKLPDYVYNPDGTRELWALINSGSGFFPNTLWLTREHGVGFDGKAQWITDINGDGHADYVYNRAGARDYHVAFNMSGFACAIVVIQDIAGVECGFSPIKEEIIGSREHVVGFEGDAQWWTDINGDGLPDLVYNKSNTYEYYAQLNSGRGLHSAKLWGTRSKGAGFNGFGQWVLDMNGDGLSDFVYNENGTGNYRVMLNLGDTLGGDVIWGTRTAGVGFGGFGQWIADMDGDGLPDYIYNDEHSPNYYVMLNNVYVPDVKTISSGLGKQTKIEYKPLTDNSVYEKLSDSVFPIVTPTLPKHVVSRHTMSDGMGNDYIFDRKYYDFKVNLHDGPLGFERVETIDYDADLIKRNHYYQEFPLVGVKSTDVLLRKSDSAWLYKNNYHYETPLNGGVHHINRTAVTAWEDENGVLKARYSTQYEYDDQQRLISKSDEGDISTPADDIFSCYAYDDYGVSDHENWWKNHSFVAEKVTANISGCGAGDITNWDSASDLRLRRQTYDSRMNLTTLSLWDNDKWVETRFEYDAYGNQTRRIDSQGSAAAIAYDGVYHTFPVSNSGGGLSSSSEYDPRFGLQTRMIDFNGRTVMEVSQMDGFGRVLEVKGIKPDSNALITTLKTEVNLGEDGKGLKITKQTLSDWDQNTWLTSATYLDSLGRVYMSESQGPEGKVAATGRVFNKQGRVWKESAAYHKGETPLYNVYEYDIYGRGIRIAYPDGSTREISYDTANRTITERIPDPSRQSGTPLIASSRRLDSRGRTIETISPNGHATRYEYDRLGNRTKTIDPLGQETVTSYNSLGQVTSVFKPEEGLLSYTYSDRGLPSEILDAKGIRTALSYDSLGRVLKKEIFSHEASEPGKTVDYAYDKGKVISIDSPEATLNFTYDFTGHLKTKKVVINDPDVEEEIFLSQYRYNPLGQLTEVIYPDNSALKYLYDGDEVSRISFKEAGGVYSDYVAYGNYQADGAESMVGYGNGIVSNYFYDTAGRLTGELTLKDQQVMRALSYNWNPAHKILGIDDDTPETSLSFGQSFSYDSNGQLSAADAGAYYNESYAYDAAGNIASRSYSKISAAASSIPVAPLKSGVAVSDAATDSGYLMYSQESVHTRFAAHPPYVANADHFIGVFYKDGKWKYNDNGSGYHEFVIRDSDTLMAAIDCASDTVTDLKGQSDSLNGIEHGYAAGGLIFEANKFGGYENPGEFHIAGSSFIPNKSVIDNIPARWPPVRGVSVDDNATGSGYLMYSKENVHHRFAANPPEHYSTYHFISVFYMDGKWKYNNDSSSYYEFTPRDSDVLVAAIDCAANTVTDLKGQSGVFNGIVRGYADGDLTFYADQFYGNSRAGEFDIIGDKIVLNNVIAENKLNFAYGDTQAKHRMTNICLNDACRTIEYDAVGNITRKGDFRYVYNLENRLVKVEKREGDNWLMVYEFSYDPFGERLMKKEADGSKTFYPFSFYQVSTTPIGAPEYTRYIDEAAASVKWGEEIKVRYFHRDHLGSVVMASDRNGQIVGRTAYSPYGRIVSSSGEDDFPPKFTGKEYDRDSGLYYFGARYYDPEMGRFLTPDMAAQFHSPYLYAANDPISYTDPDGNFVVFTVTFGAYVGAVAANGGEWDPSEMDWASSRTWTGVGIGAGVGCVLTTPGLLMLAGGGAFVGGATVNDDWDPGAWDYDKDSTYIGMGIGAGAAVGAGMAVAGTIASGGTTTPLLVGAVAGAYIAASSYAGGYDPSRWDWESPRTAAAILGGASIGIMTGVIPGGGVISSMFTNALSYAATSALVIALNGGNNWEDVGYSAAIGAASGLAGAVAAKGMGKLTSKYSSKLSKRAFANMGKASRYSKAISVGRLKRPINQLIRMGAKRARYERLAGKATKAAIKSARVARSKIFNKAVNKLVSAPSGFISKKLLFQ